MRIIAGSWGGRRLAAPRGRDVRPTTDRVREAWMSAMGGHFPGWRVMDLFAGSGALGLECLSRGAAQVTFVETSHSALRILRRNLETLGGEDRARVVQADVFQWLRERPSRDPDAAGFPDVALADPPYGKGLAARLVEIYLESPFANALWVEHARGDPLPTVAGLTQRRYGDTTLTTVHRTP